MLLLGVFLLLIKFVFRPDVSKLKSITVESIEQASVLPPINSAQKAYLWMLLAFLLMTILPTMGPLAKMPMFGILRICLCFPSFL